MFKLILICLTVLAVTSIRAHRDYEDTPAHSLISKNINMDCCAMMGGFVCGTVRPECCSGGCRRTWLGSTTCLGQKLKVTRKVCPNSCYNMCLAQGGIICGFSVTS